MQMLPKSLRIDNRGRCKLHQWELHIDKNQGEAQEADTWDNTFSKSIAMRNLVHWLEVSAPCASMWNHHLRIADLSTKTCNIR